MQKAKKNRRNRGTKRVNLEEAKTVLNQMPQAIHSIAYCLFNVNAASRIVL